ncbi:MAG TPA: hypothetical protein VKA84_18565 [Gemmatimonadaceae bacterium]|nr:hypothetical protein [Gemmatimonadaceae bacterium]
MRARIALSLAAALAAGSATAASPTTAQRPQSTTPTVPVGPGLETLRRPDAGALLRPEAERFVRQGGTTQQGGTRQTVCRGATVPAGFVIVDYDRDRTRCGGDNIAALQAWNIVVIERYDNRSVDSTMEICAATPAPAGWVLIDIFRDNRRCGRPTDPFNANVKRVRRAR